MMERFIGALSLTIMLWCLAAIAQEPSAPSDIGYLQPEWTRGAIESLNLPQWLNQFARLSQVASLSNESASQLSAQAVPTPIVANKLATKNLALSRAQLANNLTRTRQCSDTCANSVSVSTELCRLDDKPD